MPFTERGRKGLYQGAKHKANARRLPAAKLDVQGRIWVGARGSMHREMNMKRPPLGEHAFHQSIKEKAMRDLIRQRRAK